MASCFRSPFSSSPPHKKLKEYSWEEQYDKDGNRRKSLLVVCRKGTGYYLYEIGISESNGLVEGNHCDDLPLVCQLFDELDFKKSTSLECTSLGSNLHFVINEKTNNFQILTWDLKDCSYNCTVHDYKTGTDTDAHLVIDKNNKLYDPFLLVGAFGKIYALTIPTWRSTLPDDARFCCFDPIKTTRLESLPPPPFYSPSLCSVTGYAILEPHDIILFCVGVGVPHSISPLFDFYSFNIHTKEWKVTEELKTKGEQGKSKSKHNPYDPYYYNSVEGVKNFPFYGRAEIVDGVIYGYLLRTIVAYRFVVEEDGCVFLEPPVLLHKACMTMEEGSLPVTDFGDAPAFCKAPFGLPRLKYRHIAYMGNNIFCVVETVEELPEQTHFQVVFINTFRLRGEVLEILDSTIRLVAVNSTSELDQADILFCFAPFDLRMVLSRPLGTSLCSNLKEYIQGRIPKFCHMFFRTWEEDRLPLMLHAKMLFSKWRCYLQNSADPAVRFFVEFMIFALEGGPVPDPFLLVDKKLDKGCSIDLHDSMDWLDSEKHVFMALQSGSQACAIYKVDVNKTGAIMSSFLIPVNEIIKLNEGSFFGFGTSGRFAENLFLFSQKKLSDGGSSACSVIDRYVFDMEKLEVVDRYAARAATRKIVAIIAKGSKFYALCAPSKSPDCNPNAAFLCFNIASGMWEPLKDAPFRYQAMKSEYSGYADVGHNILFSFDNDQCDYHAYNVRRKKWVPVNKFESDNPYLYRPWQGRAEFVEGIIYVCVYRMVIGFVVEDLGNALFLHPPFELKGLDVVPPPLPWREDDYPTCSMTHLGNMIFCAIETGGCSITLDYQYACVRVFCVCSHGIRTLHSSICVLRTKELGTGSISYCCAPIPKQRDRKHKKLIIN